MRTTCVRPGCGGLIEAVVLIDRERNVVVLHQPEAGGPGAIALCLVHVERVTTPDGWELRDLRPVKAPAGLPDPESADDPSRSMARRRHLAAAAGTGLRVDDGATPMLGRAFRAASPGELRTAGQSRGYAWVERGHVHEPESAPEGNANNDG